MMTAAAFEDLRKLVIPNAVVVALCALWPLHLATGPGFTLAGSLNAVGCAIAVFFCGALLFSRGVIGGGDVKLLAAATLWAGPAWTPTLLVVTAVLGGLLALVLLFSATVRDAFSWARAVAVRSVPVPYGVAIAAAAMIVTIPPNLP